MSIVKEFKEFALRGNMVDLAIGVIIGAAFGKVVSSLVNDLLMPIIGLIIGGIDFSHLSLKLHFPGTTQAPVEVKYGLFLNNVLDLLIVAAAIFLVIKVMNRFRRKQEAKVEEVMAATKECPDCAMAIPAKAKKCCHCMHVF